MEHTPVLINEVLENIQHTKAPVKRFLDGTFGRGGHTRAIMSILPDLKVVGLDRDHQAIEFGKLKFSSEIEKGILTLIRSNYTDIANLNLGLFDAILLDLGVSSPQLDQGERGFSFYEEGPLDMRMDNREQLTAGQIVNEWAADDLKEIFINLGEIKRPDRVIAAIVKDRKIKPFETTRDLASMIERVEGWSRKGHHPATRFFLALRLCVNHELEDVEQGVRAMIDQLSPQGRLLVITFHSLEDTIVKRIFKSVTDKAIIINKKVIKPQWAEQKQNPRSRSAQLRVLERNIS